MIDIQVRKRCVSRRTHTLWRPPGLLCSGTLIIHDRYTGEEEVCVKENMHSMASTWSTVQWYSHNT